jgi:hypothetical protein
MGQAAVDLPETPDAAPAPLTSADDLLAQLAGAEIDRMLAESDGDLGEQEPGNMPAEHADDAIARAPADEAELNKLLESASAEAKDAADALAEQAAQAPAPVIPAAQAGTHSPAAAQSPTEDYSAQMDALFKELNAAAPAPQPASASKTTPADAPQAPTAAPSSAETPTAAPVAAPLTTEQATTVAERAALAEPIPKPTSQTDPIEPQEKPSLLVTLLEFLNAPFAACPDVLRDTLGKVAILTLMNSIGVLLYLYLFRR